MKTFDAYKTATPEDGLAILARVMEQLLDSPDCYYPYKSAPRMTEDNADNWHARDTVARLRNVIQWNTEWNPETHYGQAIKSQPANFSIDKFDRIE